MSVRRFHRFIRLAAFFALSCTVAFAQITIHVPDATHPTIQSGIDAASIGDTVLVAPGTYNENIDFKGKAITVTSSGGAASTIIDGGSRTPAVTFKSSEPRASILSGITIQHGGPTSETYSGTGNGGIFISNSSPTILNNVITLNNCWDILTVSAAPLIQGNEISATQDPNGQCTFGGGAGIYVGGNFYGADNTASNGVAPVIIGNTIENNLESGLEDAGGNGGAGIAVWGGSPLIENNTIRNNYSPGGSGGAINIESGTGITIIQNLIYGNRAGCGGGAIATDNGSEGQNIDLLVANNTIVDNLNDGEGGYSECAQISQIYPSPDAYGTSGPSVVFVNNIVSGSTTYPALNCSWFDAPSEAIQPIFDHNILLNAESAFFGSYCVDVSAKYGNLSVDPQFVDPAHGDYHLKLTSPAIDSGNTSAIQILQQMNGTELKQDLDNNARLQDATGKGYPVIDIGAYEFSGQTDASPTTMVLSSSAYTGNAGSNYTLTASLASPLGTPTGSAVFFLDGKQIGASTIASSGVATLPNVLMTPGVHSLYATYAGQGSFTPAISVIIIVNISRYTTGLTLTSSLNPSIVGQSVTFTLTTSTADPAIPAYVPTPITLMDTSTNTLLANLTPDLSGTATFTTSALVFGGHYITASYAGDLIHSSAGADVFQNVDSGYPTGTVLTSSFNPSVTGQSITFTATITSANGIPTGSVQFSDGATVLGTQPLNASGIATFIISTLTVGNHPITATYIPTGTFSASSENLNQTVQAAPYITISSSPNPSVTGQNVTFTATVHSAGSIPNGTVVFYDGPNILDGRTLDSFGVATLSTDKLTIGPHTITAIAAFTPTGSLSESIANLVQNVREQPPVVTLVASPSTGWVYATPITLTATAPGPTGNATPTGNVVFSVNGTQLATRPLVNGVATYSSPLPLGADQVVANYLGDTLYPTSTSNTALVTITADPTSLEIYPPGTTNTVFALMPFSFRVQLSLSNGNPAGSGYPVTITVTPIASGSTPALTTTLSTDASGAVVLTNVTLLSGNYQIAATFAGTTDLLPSTAMSVVETVVPNLTMTTLTASPNPGIQGEAITFTTAVVATTGAITPTGTVTILDGTATIATYPATTTTFTTSSLAPGTHTLVAVFTPDASFGPSQSTPLSLTVLAQSFTLTLSEPTITIQTGHHGSLTATLTSLGGLTAPFTFSCASLPAYASCAWGQTTVTLPPNGSVDTKLTIDTDEIPGFYSSVDHRDESSSAGRIVFACLLPLSLLGFKRRRNLRSLLPLFLLAILATTLTACGAGKYPYSTAPGTYTIPITATGYPNGPDSPATQTVNLTLIVTP